MDLGPTGPAVNLMNGIGQPQAALAVRPDGLPGLAIFDHTGQARVSMDVNEGGAPSLHLYGRQGQLRAAMAIRPDGSPGLGFFDADGQLKTSFENPEKPAGPPERDDVH